MAEKRQDDQSTKRVEDTIRRAGESSVEQAKRIRETTGRVGEELAQASSNLLQHNAETLQNAWRFGLDMTKAVMGRSADQFGSAFGLTGDQAQQATQRSARSAESIIHSATAASKGLTGISEEYFKFVRHQVENGIDRMNDLWRCRTPQDVAAVQSDLVCDTMEQALESTRRMADMSLKLADEAAKHITNNMERMQRAA